MSIWLARRQAAMKFLYKTNFELYLQLCKQLKIRCIRFAIPDSRCRSKQSNTLAVDGDRCRFLIRQKIWWSRHRPATIRDPGTRKLVIYTRHPVEQPPWNWGAPKAHKHELSRRWPYGVSSARQEGSYPIANPTAAGSGHIPVPMLF
eukprot:GHVT01035033.1.p1 GENE.GHVT01035033.1~~GHVT01035033.1.p1  ORF type:complete len:147 (+),score=28.86 GHVT01035033.1:628-1068(+)